MLTLSTPGRLTPAYAAAQHRDATVDGIGPIWFVTTNDPAFPGYHVARAHTADYKGGVWLPGALVSSTLVGLVAMLPPGLTREGTSAFDPLGLVETWW